LAKLEQLLRARLRHRIHALQAATVPLTGPSAAVDPDVLTAIAAARRDHQRLRFRYRSHDETASDRVVEPHRLVHTPRRWYLVAYDTDRQDCGTIPVGALLGGALGAAIGVRPTMWIMLSGVVLATLTLLIGPIWRHPRPAELPRPGRRVTAICYIAV
jgi:hypothetical protein